MNKMPLVSVIIVNWNGGKVFTSCLASLTKVNYRNLELIIVDNGSNDGTEKLAVIRNKTNIGFASANNQGYKKAKGKYLLLLNNDTVVKPDLLDVLVKKMENDPSIGVLQPKVKIMNNPKYLDNAGSFITKIGFLEHWGFQRKDSKEFDQEKEIFTAKGACMLIRKSVVDKIGLFDDDFISYFEESDFCWRVWLIGLKIIYYPETYIYHKVGMTSKRMNQVKINYHAIKNRICSLIKNLDGLNLVLVLVPHLFINILLMFYYLIRFQFGKGGMINSAISWNIVNLKTTLIKRRVIQKMRITTDKKIFKRVGKPVKLWQMLIHFKKVEANFK